MGNLKEGKEDGILRGITRKEFNRRNKLERGRVLGEKYYDKKGIYPKNISGNLPHILAIYINYITNMVIYK